jgi:methylornithine synthase
MGTVVDRSVFHLDRILSKSLTEVSLTREEIGFLLNLRDEEDLGRLFDTAREIRRRHFGDAVFLYGFVYFSTWCRNDCTFCRYRRSNQMAQRYRKDKREVLDIAGQVAESGVHLIDLTMGEDPLIHREADRLIDLVWALKDQTGLPVMVSPGVVGLDVLKALSGVGADWYACYQETHNRGIFRRLRPGQDYEQRLRVKREAREVGLLIEEGILAGVGEGTDDILMSLEVIDDLGAHQLRVMTFVPQEGTPMADFPSPSWRGELSIIAVMRLLFPDRLIPASLDVGGIAGLRERLLAGANVITSIIPPHRGLVGVSQSVLDVEEGYRTVRGVLPVLEEMGLRTATQDEYTRWVCGEHGSMDEKNRHLRRMP